MYMLCILWVNTMIYSPNQPSTDIRMWCFLFWIYIKFDICENIKLCVFDFVILTVSVENPILIHPHSKTVLTLAITHDSHFLASHRVMDYSLLVGVDDNQQELVVGIIGIINFSSTSKLKQFPALQDIFVKNVNWFFSAEFLHGNNEN